MTEIAAFYNGSLLLPGQYNPQVHKSIICPNGRRVLYRDGCFKHALRKQGGRGCRLNCRKLNEVKLDESLISKAREKLNSRDYKLFSILIEQGRVNDDYIRRWNPNDLIIAMYDNGIISSKTAATYIGFEVSIKVLLPVYNQYRKSLPTYRVESSTCIIL